MTCAEFQKVLPYIIDTGGNAEQQEHLKRCPACSELVADLQYIADQAKLLVPMVEPSPRVWDEIQSSLQDEGLVRPKRARGKVLSRGAANRAGPTRLLPVLALVLLGLGTMAYRSHLRSNTAATQAATPKAMAAVAFPIAMTASDDDKFLSAVAARHPESRAFYEAGLKAVNQYIADARRWAEQNPADPEGAQLLRRAYRQKSVLYQMARPQSLP